MSIKKNLLAMCLIGLAFVLRLSFWNSADAKSSADLENDIYVDTAKSADEKDKLTAFMVLELERARLRSELGPNSIYPEFYVGVEQEKLTGKTELAAIRDTENEMVEHEALVWYAASHGSRITDEEARQRLEQALAEVKSTDNYAELVEACKAAGTTIEAMILENKDFYKKIFVGTDLCDMKHETFMEDQSISEKGSGDWEIHWNAFVKETIAAYKETEEFSILAKKITNSKELIREGITDATKIKAMEQ
ncbi:MAG: hypothetical protein HFE75_02065 [Firmicutes bacterium]|nr:hypothetical protein [Bacillota bacterium]